MASKRIHIGGKTIGNGQPVFIVAEAGVNHNGSLQLAKKLIDVAAKAGADAVKFQTFDPDTLVTEEAAKASYQKKNERKGKQGETQHAMLKRLQLPREHHVLLKRHAEKKGIIFLSTPFSLKDALFLRTLGLRAFKVGSTDTNNLPYLAELASWKLPIILSTGMSDLFEVREAVATIKKAGNTRLVLLHTTTNYPTPFSEANLRAIQTLHKEFALPVGFSDHTVGSEAAVASVALGASIIEKHFTLNRNLPGPDHQASLEPDELRDFVAKIRNTEAALGTGKKIPFRSEKETAEVARKSLVTLETVTRGELFTKKNLTIKRPGTGLPPKEYERVIGKTATKEIPADTLLTKKMFK